MKRNALQNNEREWPGQLQTSSDWRTPPTSMRNEQCYGGNIRRYNPAQEREHFRPQPQADDV
jgi:hypothetical protein